MGLLRLECKRSFGAKVLYGADWIAFVFSADNPQGAIDRRREVLAERLGINREQSETCLTQMAGLTSEAAEQLSNELELAREIQRSLLPGLMPPDFPATGINTRRHHTADAAFREFKDPLRNN